MKRGHVFLGLSLAGLLGCAGNPHFQEYEPKTRTNRLMYKGDAGDYLVRAEEVIVNDFCLQRIIVLNERTGLHIKPDHVSYVKAWDNGCNNSIETWYFKDQRYVMTERLKE